MLLMSEVPRYLEGRAGVVEVLLLLPEHPVGDLPGVWGFGV